MRSYLPIILCIFIIAGCGIEEHLIKDTPNQWVGEQSLHSIDGNYKLLPESKYTLSVNPSVQLNPFFPINGDDDDAGTWQRDGDTLTLISDYGTVIKFEYVR